MQFRFIRNPAKFLSIAALTVCGLSLFATAAQACPMCSQSIAEENLLPHAYMYSIVFMLSMPAMVFTGIGSFIFFQYRKAAAGLPSSDGVENFTPTIEPDEPGLAPQV